MSSSQVIYFLLISECKSNLESLICSLSDKFRAQVELVSTVPGIQFFSAVSVISEIGVTVLLLRIPLLRSLNRKATLLWIATEL